MEDLEKVKKQYMKVGFGNMNEKDLKEREEIIAAELTWERNREILLERVKVLENSLDKTIWNVDELKEAIDDIRNGMHGLKEINTTLRKLVREVQDKL